MAEDLDSAQVSTSPSAAASAQAERPLGLEQFRDIVRGHYPDRTVASFEAVRPTIGRSGLCTTYILALDPPATSFLTVCGPDAQARGAPAEGTPDASAHATDQGDAHETNQDDAPPPGMPHTLELIAHLAERIRTHTSLPVPAPVLGARARLRYMLTAPAPLERPVPLSEAALTPEQRALVDLRLGRAFAELHENVQNDWFGLPVAPAPAPAHSLPALPALAGLPALAAAPADTAYSWQATFTGLLEDLLQRLPPAAAAAVPLAALRAALARAIGAFLFDDAAVPALVAPTGSAACVFVQACAGDGGDVRAVVAPAPALAHAVFGDPLLEGVFLPPGPGAAFEEGYGRAPVVFPRQRTKRLWYTLFAALLALAAGPDDAEAGALRMAVETAEALKTAPAY
ncbi:hypothetical protein HDZ31DRAFT_67039 [Schizophyllum fasciatum]